MKLYAIALLLAALWQTQDPVAADLPHFQYQRFVTSLAGTGTQLGSACAVLPGDLYAHSPTLADVRLYIDITGSGMTGVSGKQQVPYVLSTSQTAPTSDPATVLNAGLRSGHIVFDLAMPPRPYTDVKLSLSGQNFIANATVTGLNSVADLRGTALGSFTLFDLSSTGLGHSTTLTLVESTFPYLHVDLAVSGAGGKPFTANRAFLVGAEVPPSRQAQILYTDVASTSSITQVGRHSVAKFHLPAHVPVERVTFTLAPANRTSFSRNVSILAHADTRDAQDSEASESVVGTIDRIHLAQGGRELRKEDLSVPATLGANMDASADVQVWVENGDDKPLALASVQLQMRQRLLCFDAQSATRPTLYYGDPTLGPPVYDYSRTFNPTTAAVAYQLTPEQPNPLYTPRSALDDRTLVDRHPKLIWLVLFAVVGALGFVAYRNARRF